MNNTTIKRVDDVVDWAENKTENKVAITTGALAEHCKEVGVRPYQVNTLFNALQTEGFEVFTDDKKYVKEFLAD